MFKSNQTERDILNLGGLIRDMQGDLYRRATTRDLDRVSDTVCALSADFAALLEGIGVRIETVPEEPAKRVLVPVKKKGKK
jgi:hypothetical protein